MVAPARARNADTNAGCRAGSTAGAGCQSAGFSQPLAVRTHCSVLEDSAGSVRSLRVAGTTAATVPTVKSSIRMTAIVRNLPARQRKERAWVVLPEGTGAAPPKHRRSAEGWLKQPPCQTLSAGLPVWRNCLQAGRLRQSRGTQASGRVLPIRHTLAWPVWRHCITWHYHDTWWHGPHHCFCSVERELAVVFLKGTKCRATMCPKRHSLPGGYRW